MSTSKSRKYSQRNQTSKNTQASRRSSKSAALACGVLSTRFSSCQLLEQFRRLLPAKLLLEWLAGSPRDFYQRAFTPLIVLWYFIFQRLQPKHTLSKILSDARCGGADCLSPAGKCLSKKILSVATAAFSKARVRLPLEVFDKTLSHSAQEIRSWSKGLTWLDWNIALLDGSTFRLRPHGDIAKTFPPHRTGRAKHEPYWCLVRVVAAFCLHSGVVLNSVMGNLKQSEQALSAQLLAVGSWAKWLFVGDRNFGVYCVVRSAVAVSGQVLFRLTEERARKLARQSGLKLFHSLDALITWNPSPRDQCPPGLERLPVQGRLVVWRLQRPGFRTVELFLFTTLTNQSLYSAAQLVELYGQRWQVELYLRYVKTQMELEFFDCKSADMARKEWLAGLIAYNLIRSIMVAAAAQAKIPVKLLSFTRTADLFHDWLIRWLVAPSQTLGWEQLLKDVASCRQPRRKKVRPPEPRRIREFSRDFPKLCGDRAAARKTLNAANAKS